MLNARRNLSEIMPNTKTNPRNPRTPGMNPREIQGEILVKQC